MKWTYPIQYTNISRLVDVLCILFLFAVYWPLKIDFFGILLRFIIALPFDQNPLLIIVVLLISGGLFMFTFESTQFNLEGFVMVLLASFLGGIRWTLTQVLMQKAELGQCRNYKYWCQYREFTLFQTLFLLSHHSGLQNPVDALYHIQPLMFIGLFPLFQYNEGLY